MRDEGTNNCPSCHAVLVKGMRFCRMCGYRLGEGVEEYVATRRFDAAAPPVPPQPRGTDPTVARNTWGAAAPVQPAAPLANAPASSSLSRVASAFNPARMGWWSWIITACVIMLVLGLGTKVLRNSMRGGGGDAAPIKVSIMREADGFETADGGGAFLEGLAGPGTTLEAAGIIGGDVIISIDGKPVRNESALLKILESLTPGKAVEVTYLRDGETRKTTLTPAGERAFRGLAEIDARPGGKGQIGVDLGDRVRVPDSNTYGVELAEVHRNRPADIAGLKDGDVVIEFNGKPTRTPGDLRLRIYEAVPGSTVPVVVLRGNERLEIAVKVGRSKD